MCFPQKTGLGCYNVSRAEWQKAELENTMPSTKTDSIPVTYDRYGRMNYHPEFHGKQGEPWTTTDEKYLIENYEILGPEQVSLAMERTIHTVMTRAYELRKAGRMSKPAKKQSSKRIPKNAGLGDVQSVAN